MPAFQAVVVLEAVLIDGLADLTADLAADGAAAEASHGGSGDGAEDGSGGADERAVGGAELSGPQGCCGAAGGSGDGANGGACGATAIEGLDAGGLALGATGHGGSPWGRWLEGKKVERTGKEKAPGGEHAGLEGRDCGQFWRYRDGITPGRAGGACRAGRALDRVNAGCIRLAVRGSDMWLKKFGIGFRWVLARQQAGRCGIEMDARSFASRINELYGGELL